MQSQRSTVSIAHGSLAVAVTPRYRRSPRRRTQVVALASTRADCRRESRHVHPDQTVALHVKTRSDEVSFVASAAAAACNMHATVPRLLHILACTMTSSTVDVQCWFERINWQQHTTHGPTIYMYRSASGQFRSFQTKAEPVLHLPHCSRCLTARRCKCQRRLHARLAAKLRKGRF
jgi:hypothetical protein